jgi:translation initiation factor IF-3
MRDAALDKAREFGLDLVEIAPKADPPVCKIIDFGKFKYEQQKKEKQQRKHQQTTAMKEIRFHPNTDTHDFDFKTRHAIEFLEDGNKVKATVRFKGREMAYTEKGADLLKRFIDEVGEIAKVETPINMEGRFMHVIVVPDKSKQKKS